MKKNKYSYKNIFTGKKVSARIAAENPFMYTLK